MDFFRNATQTEKILIEIIGGLFAVITGLIMFGNLLGFLPRPQAPAPIVNTLPPLPPTWTPKGAAGIQRYQDTSTPEPPAPRRPSSTPVPSSIPLPSVTNVPPFRGYEPIEKNSTNYPAINPASLYSSNDELFKKRFQFEGNIVDLGYITINGENVYAIQVGPDLHNPPGSVVARSPVLVLSFDSENKLEMNSHIIVFGSGGKMLIGENTMGGTSKFPIVYGEWYEAYRYQNNDGGDSGIPPGCYNCP